MRVKKSVCRKEQGKAEHGNTCLQTPGTCESCPNWWKRESNAEELYRASRRGFEKFKAELARHYAAREREEWIPCEVRMPPQYHSALITHIETRDGSPTVEEARWDGERWCLARTDPQDNMIYLDEQVSAWREIPAPFAAKGETE